MLSRPKVVELSGVKYVTASVEPSRCQLEAQLNYSTVCLSLVGEDSPGQCAILNRSVPADYTYRPRATYLVNGQGCADSYQPPQTVCPRLPSVDCHPVRLPHTSSARSTGYTGSNAEINQRLSTLSRVTCTLDDASLGVSVPTTVV